MCGCLHPAHSVFYKMNKLARELNQKIKYLTKYCLKNIMLAKMYYCVNQIHISMQIKTFFTFQKNIVRSQIMVFGIVFTKVYILKLLEKQCPAQFTHNFFL